MMSVKQMFQISIFAVVVSVISACSHQTGDKALNDQNGGSSSAYGIRNMPKFGQSMEGEEYSTRAPHNQVWLFAFDDDHVKEKYMPALEAQANYLKNHPHAKILIAGHTDLRGSREYNIALGERRAKSVARLLRKYGVSHSQYRIVSYGKERPISLEYNDKAHQKNRRVELIYEATR